MARHLGALFPGDPAHQRRWQILHTGYKSGVQGIRVTAGQVDQPQHSGLPFDQRADWREVRVVDNEVAFPVPGHGSIVNRDGPVVDGEHWLLEPRPPALLALVGSAVIRPVRSGE